ncbi:MAG: phenylacetate-CoA oxygenase/reductase subunit PaaK [Proteobacteria bacterium]|nr:MAG: phenylacetate-CoA oxygenase/reductase subunit PaaK [Pseudomonadota bacterium]
MASRFHSLTIADVRRETADAISVAFAVPEALAAEYAFVQGQHITLKAYVDGVELRRSYSICAGIDDRELRVAIKLVPGGVFSPWATQSLRVGAALEVLTPEGRFHTPLAPENRKHYVAFAAGSGITPILSLIKTILAREPASRFTLVYGNRRQASVMFHEVLEDLKDRYLPRFALYHVFSQERQDVGLFNGRLEAEKVRAFVDTLLPIDIIDEAFICGPGGMIDEVEATLLACGLTQDHIHTERFGMPVPGGGPRIEAGDAPQARIGLMMDGVQREVDLRDGHGSILEAALAAGVELPYSCKGGMCCTCRAKLLEGRVRMDKNYSLEQRDLEAGFVLLCQAHPLTERVVVSYDER